MKRLLPSGWLLAGALLLGCATLLAAQVSQPDRELFDEAERRFSAGAYELAVDRYEELIRRYPGSEFATRAQVGAAQATYYLGNYQEALEVLQRTAVRARGGAIVQEIRLWIGLSAYQLGEFGTARDAFDAYLAVGGEQSGRAALYRGLIRRDSGNVADAREDLSRALDELDGAEALYAAGVLIELAAAESAWDEVLELTFRADAIDPDRADPTAELRVRRAADAAWELEAWDEAARLYGELAMFGQGSAQWAYQRLYSLAEERDDRAEMQRIFRSAEQRLAGEPARLAAFWEALGRDALERERYELAELYLIRLWDVRREQPVGGAVPLLLARAIEAQGRVAEAQSLLVESLSDADTGPEGETERRVAAARLSIEAGDPATAVDLLDGHAPALQRADALYVLAYALSVTDEVDRALALVDAPEAQPVVRELPSLLYLRARLLLEAGDATESVRAYRTYLAGSRGDRTARLELVRALVAARQFSAARQEGNALAEAVSVAGRENELAYLRGLAAFQAGAFDEARTHLTTVTGEEWEPMRSYHLAWASYRLGSTEEAVTLMASVLEDLPEQVRFEGGYLLSWGYVQLRRFEDASRELLRLLSFSPSPASEVLVRRLLALAYIEVRRIDDALVQYQALIDLPESADDRARAWADYASLLASVGRVEEAIAEYEALYARLPTTAAGRDALLDVGQLEYTLGDFESARDRFREYQVEFPSSAQLDRALYWAGATSRELGESARALLWWEPLIRDYPRSSYAPGAMFETAAIYVERGQRRQALELYDRFTAAYPDDARTADAETLRRRLRLEIDGLSTREADLWVRLEPPSATPPAVGSDTWFSLVLELGRVAIREQITLTADRFRIIPYLEDAAAVERPQAGEASLLLAEFYRRRGDAVEAIRRYLDAAATAGAGDELRAQSLYEIAILAGEIGDRTTAETAREELRTRYGDTVWADRAAELEGGAR